MRCARGVIVPLMTAWDSAARRAAASHSSLTEDRWLQGSVDIYSRIPPNPEPEENKTCGRPLLAAITATSYSEERESPK